MPPLGQRNNVHAATLRANLTRAERTLWFAIRNRALGGYKIRRQVSLGRFIVDFLCVEARLVIEIEGGQHSAEIDLERTASSETLGYGVIRFWNNEVNDNLGGVLAVLLERLEIGTARMPSADS